MFNRIEKNPPGPIFRESYQNNHIVEHLSAHLYSTLLSKVGFYDIVFVCIGTDRSTGDSLGPIVGSKLNKLYLDNITVYGTLDDPVHAMNLEEIMTHIDKVHPNPFVIAIDACLGELKSVGMITLAQGPLKPGAGVQKKLPDVGDIHITGIVNVGGFMEYFVLQNTRLSVVMNMADKIAAAIYQASIQLKRKGTPQARWDSIVN